LVAGWMTDQRRKINELLGDVLEQVELADELSDGELADSFLGEQCFLRDIYDDLEISHRAVDMLSIRPMIEALTKGVEVSAIHFEFPELTPEYRAHLQAMVRGGS